MVILMILNCLQFSITLSLSIVSYNTEGEKIDRVSSSSWGNEGAIDYFVIWAESICIILEWNKDEPGGVELLRTTLHRLITFSNTLTNAQENQKRPPMLTPSNSIFWLAY